MISSVTQANFNQQVLQASHPVIVHFWAPWCGLCRLINPSLAKIESEFPGLVQLVGINADDNLKLANTYRLKTLPTIIVFNQGEMIDKIEGYQGRDELYQRLHNLIQNIMPESVVSNSQESIVSNQVSTFKH